MLGKGNLLCVLEAGLATGDDIKLVVGQFQSLVDAHRDRHRALISLLRIPLTCRCCILVYEVHLRWFKRTHIVHEHAAIVASTFGGEHVELETRDLGAIAHRHAVGRPVIPRVDCP